jgi:hypothetical protein
MAAAGVHRKSIPHGATGGLIIHQHQQHTLACVSHLYLDISEYLYCAVRFFVGDAKAPSYFSRKSLITDGHLVGLAM